MTRIVTANEQSIAEAATLLKEGRLVAIPTETVYGLGADALSGAAVAKIFEAKGRPQFNPLISHVASAEDAEKFAVMDEWAKELAHAFWPGPLTLVLPRKPDCKISDLACAGLSTVAIRVPAHPVAQALLKECGFPVAAPSANLSGTLSPTTPMHVAQSLGERVDMILAAGPCKVGLESTVLDLSEVKPLILRPGAITPEDIERVIGVKPDYATVDDHAPKAPGMLLKHYAPDAKLRLNAIDLSPGEALLAFGGIKFMGIKGGGAAKDLPDDMIRNLSEEADLHKAAANLFAMLKELDQPGCAGIAVMNIPETGLGIAINDRLKRAAN
jgi:L-threonylcarbamoyladenylate synthase